MGCPTSQSTLPTSQVKPPSAITAVNSAGCSRTNVSSTASVTALPAVTSSGAGQPETPTAARVAPVAVSSGPA